MKFVGEILFVYVRKLFYLLAMKREKKTLLNVDLFPRDFSFGVLSPVRKKICIYMS